MREVILRDFIEQLNDNKDFIDVDNRLKAVILYNGEFYFGKSHGGILSHILRGTDTLNGTIFRDISLYYNRNQKKVAFGNLIEDNTIIFEDLQSFWNVEEETEEEEFYTLIEITTLLRSHKTELLKTITKAYTILRDSHDVLASYNLGSLKQVL